MRSREQPLEQQRSEWPSCAIWDARMAGDQKVQPLIPMSQVVYPFFFVFFWEGKHKIEGKGKKVKVCRTLVICVVSLGLLEGLPDLLCNGERRGGKTVNGSMGSI